MTAAIRMVIVFLVAYLVCLVTVFLKLLGGTKFSGWGLKESVVDPPKTLGVRRSFAERLIQVVKEWRLV